MPAAVSAALILKRGTDGLTLAQLHELQANEGKVQRILDTINEAREIALAQQRKAAEDMAALVTAGAEKEAAWSARESEIAAGESALKAKQEADRIANEAAARALNEQSDTLTLRVEQLLTDRAALISDGKAFDAARAAHTAELDERQSAIVADRAKLDQALADVAKAQSEAEAALAKANEMIAETTARQDAMRAVLGVKAA